MKTSNISDDMTLTHGETIALAIRSHQTTIGEDWAHADLARVLHRWVELFDSEFNLDLPVYPVIQFGPMRNAYATYQASRTGLGTKDNITFNVREMHHHVAQILSTLCHELIHLWQQYHGQAAWGNYHNGEFRAKALECGLIVSRSGCHSGHDARFTSVLAKYGVSLSASGTELDEEFVAPRLYGAVKRALKMQKWSCGCTNVRCATALHATCDRCDAQFERAEPRGTDGRGTRT